MRNRHSTTSFQTIAHWDELAAVMAAHPDWTVHKCKRRLLDGFTIEQIKNQED